MSGDIASLVSPAELEVWRLIALGFSRYEIADRTGAGKSVKTVDNQRLSLRNKLMAVGVPANRTADPTRSAVRYSVITLDPIVATEHTTGLPLPL